MKTAAASAMLRRDSSTVTGKAWPISLTTRSWVRRERPKSPTAARRRNRRNWTGQGESSPSRARTWAISAAVARSPIMTSTGSPGIRRIATKTIRTAATRTGPVSRNRRRMRATIARPRLLGHPHLVHVEEHLGRVQDVPLNPRAGGADQLRMVDEDPGRLVHDGALGLPVHLDPLLPIKRLLRLLEELVRLDVLVAGVVARP